MEPATEIAIARATRTQEIPAATATLATDQPTELATTPIVIEYRRRPSPLSAPWNQRRKTCDCEAQHGQQEIPATTLAPATVQPAELAATPIVTGSPTAESYCPRSGASDGNCDCAHNANGRSRAGNGPARRACSDTGRDGFADGRVRCPRSGTGDEDLNCEGNADSRNPADNCPAHRACSHTERDRFADGRVYRPRSGASDGNCDCARNANGRSRAGNGTSPPSLQPRRA